jgi:hypothetical protein
MYRLKKTGQLREEYRLRLIGKSKKDKRSSVYSNAY